MPDNWKMTGMKNSRNSAGSDAYHFDHGGQVHHYAALQGRSWSDLIDFSANINPLGPPASVLQVLQDNLAVIRHYPDPNHVAVKGVLAKHLGVDPAQILCGNGASEVIDLLLQSLKPQRVVVLEPAFSEYKRAAKRQGIEVLSLSLVGPWNSSLSSLQLPLQLPSLQLPLDELDRALQRGDLLFLNTPHNPTGACLKAHDWIARAHAWLERGAQVVVDESFLDFLPDETEYTVIPQAVKSESLFVVRSATKFYALPGLRFGFAIGSASHFQQIERLRDGWSVNQLAQIAAVEAYQDKGFQQATWEWLRAEQEHVRRLWTQEPSILPADATVTLHMGQVNFFLLQFHHVEVGHLVEQHLRARGMLIRNCSNFAGLESGFYRLAIRTAPENLALYKGIMSYLETLK